MLGTSTSKFMKQKRNYPNFDMSEPEFLISHNFMNRHTDWAVIICLIGMDKKSTGEAGLSEWFSY